MAKKNKKAPELTSWLRRAQRYAVAWVLFLAILMLFIANNLGIRLPISMTFDDLDSVITGKPNAGNYGGITNVNAPLADLFTTSVDYWGPAIYKWAQEYQLNPNLIATVIQIESCGHPYIESFAGAQGPFQVMPINFEAGENQFDPDTNAGAGLEHLKSCLYWSSDQDLDGIIEGEPDVGVALACYNGGFLPPEQWYPETRDYYVWGTGIWGDASQGKSHSDTLDQWLRQGGALLCPTALAAQREFDPLQLVD